ncbi:hypothetical protein ACH5RR_003030 [Cinchona calisaya]|uniref:Endonuclease/exonuclease/phosphatase domain-containing protein n=1 Tax=Cinchona calisaya TaxID=153742 RepID=A0ABD3ATN0_9GENT
MKVMVWNCQGMESPLTVPQLKENVLLLFPDLIFLYETKNTKQTLDTARKKINFDNVFVVDACRKASDMAVFWNRNLSVKTIFSTCFTIEVEIQTEMGNGSWWILRIYASSDSSIRREQWKVIQRRKELWGDHWIVAGDFNDITSTSEKLGGGKK